MTTLTTRLNWFAYRVRRYAFPLTALTHGYGGIGAAR